MNPWIILIFAGLFEIGWPVGIKMSQTPGRGLLGIIIAICFMGVSGYLLWMAQKTIPIGTAYAIWTGIGAAGTFIVGILIYGDSVGLLRILAVLLIISGVALLKLAH
ncbi:MAG: multidrug efflux SMR transporter [Chthoniobacterales bacterium]